LVTDLVLNHLAYLLVLNLLGVDGHSVADILGIGGADLGGKDLVNGFAIGGRDGNGSGNGSGSNGSGRTGASGDGIAVPGFFALGCGDFVVNRFAGNFGDRVTMFNFNWNSFDNGVVDAMFCDDRSAGMFDGGFHGLGDCVCDWCNNRGGST